MILNIDNLQKLLRNKLEDFYYDNGLSSGNSEYHKYMMSKFDTPYPDLEVCFGLIKFSKLTLSEILKK